MSVYPTGWWGKMECPGCTKTTVIKYMDGDGNPTWLYDHRASKDEACPVIEAGGLLPWHYQRMRSLIVESGTHTPPKHPKTQRHPPADVAGWLASLGGNQ